MSTIRISGIRVVVFDLDDTLYPEQSFALSGFAAVADWLRERMPCPVDPARRMRELFETQDRRHVFDQLLAEWGCDEPETLIPAMVDCYRSHSPSIRLWDDADAALRRWAGRYRLGLISDGPVQMQQNKIKALGLAGRLDRIILTDQWGQSFWKPHPRAYREIEATWGSAGSQCIYIADNTEKDFIAPRQLNWRTAVIRRGGVIYLDAKPPPGGEPEYEAVSLADIDLSP